MVLSCICFSRLDSALGASLPHGLCVFHRSGLMPACLCGLPQALSIGLIGAPSGELPSDLTWGLSHGLTKLLISQLHRRTCHKLDIRLAQRCTINSSRDYFDALTCKDSLHIDLSSGLHVLSLERWTSRAYACFLPTVGGVFQLLITVELCLTWFSLVTLLMCHWSRPERRRDDRVGTRGNQGWQDV